MATCIPFTFPYCPRIRCVFTTRKGGTSLAPFRGNNISLEVGDDPARVHANRQALREVCGVSRWCELKQVHGCDIHIDPQDDALLELNASGDGLATCEQNVGLVIKTADCQPILMAHVSGAYIAAIHCGWRGNRQHFPGKAVAAFCHAYGLKPADIMAVRGPSLGPANSEFTQFHTEWGHEFTRYFDSRTQTINLWQMTRDQLLRAGLLPEHIFGLDLCTYSMKPWFFSYRRNTVCGRQAAIIWIES